MPLAQILRIGWDSDPALRIPHPAIISRMERENFISFLFRGQTLLVEPQSADRVRLLGTEDHPHGDTLVLLKVDILDHVIVILIGSIDFLYRARDILALVGIQLLLEG